MLALNPASPSALVRRVGEGDRGAFAELARLWTPMALRLSVKVLLDAHEAEDAVQAALLNLWRKADGFDPARGAPEPWFRRMVVNAALDRRRTIRPVQPIEAAAHAPAHGPNPHMAAETADEAGRVNAAIAQLNPRQRAAIALFYGEEASTAEVATALDTTPKAIEGLLARARSELARIMGRMRDDA